MDEEWNTLRPNLPQLVSLLQPKSLHLTLFAAFLITREEYERIEVLGDKKGSQELLISILPRKGPGSFKRFLSILNRTEGQEHIVHLLENRLENKQSSEEKMKEMERELKEEKEKGEQARPLKSNPPLGKRKRNMLVTSSPLEKMSIEDVSDGYEMTNGKRLRLESHSLEPYPGLRSILNEVPITLTVLNIGGCGLSAIPESISQLTNLQRLRVEANNLSKFPRSMGRLTNLKRLRAYGNELSWLPEEFGDLRSLQILRLGGNKFKTHHHHDGLRAIKYMSALRKLYLRENPGLREIPGYVATKRDLETFGVDQCIIENSGLSYSVW